MKRTLYILLGLFVFSSASSQTRTGTLQIQFLEKTKEGDQITAGQFIEVVIDNSEHFSLKTDNDGKVIITDRSIGPCNVSVKRVDCATQEMKNIVIGEGKTSHLTYTLICASYINSLSKRQRRKLGYKFQKETKYQTWEPNRADIE